VCLPALWGGDALVDDVSFRAGTPPVTYGGCVLLH